MKKVIIFSLVLFASMQLLAQTEGISYQAVIIGPDGQEMPGVDAQGNILPDASVAIRFTILDVNNIQEFQEVQLTNTDRYGRVNLMIGSEDPDGFSLVVWDGTSKNLKVEIDFSGRGNSFVDMSRQELNFVPYSFHRNIIARGTLVVDDVTDLNGELRVAGPTNLNSTLNVNNGNTTNLSGGLDVSGSVSFDSSLVVVGSTTINNELNVDSAAYLRNDLTVGGLAQFEGATRFDNLNVDGTSTLSGQVIVDVDLTNSADELVYNQYPLLVQGSNQGIAIKVNESRSQSNNYISFWDQETGSMWGRIEGQTESNLKADAEYKTELGVRIADVTINGIEGIMQIIAIGFAIGDLGTEIADVRVVVPIGAATPGPGKIIFAAAKLVAEIANGVLAGANLALAGIELGTFIDFRISQLGVSYQSGSGDYAEWLPKENPGEKFIAGELVGLRKGFISKRVFGADKVMVVSSNPIVLGNMPQEIDESKYEKIAFMGQVPVRVLGEVQSGDYILPSELGSGFGKAVHPDEMTTRDYKKIVGVAWENMFSPMTGFSIVNVAVGINNNDIADLMAKQEERLANLLLDHDQLQSEVINSNMALAKLVPGYSESLGYDSTSDFLEALKERYPIIDVNNTKSSSAAYPVELEIPTIEFKREYLEESIKLAQEDYQQMYMDASLLNKTNTKDDLNPSSLIDVLRFDPAIQRDLYKTPIDEHPFWSRMNSDPEYREEIIQYIKTSLEKNLQQQETKGEKKFNIRFVNF